MPRTVEQHERSLHRAAFCELLPVRDIMHHVIIRTNGAFMAGLEKDLDYDGLRLDAPFAGTRRLRAISPPQFTSALLLLGGS
jgi:hypothetical protein